MRIPESLSDPSPASGVRNRVMPCAHHMFYWRPLFILRGLTISRTGRAGHAIIIRIRTRKHGTEHDPTPAQNLEVCAWHAHHVWRSVAGVPGHYLLSAPPCAPVQSAAHGSIRHTGRRRRGPAPIDETTWQEKATVIRMLHTDAFLRGSVCAIYGR
jgi:hypothetical protein